MQILTVIVNLNLVSKVKAGDFSMSHCDNGPEIRSPHAERGVWPRETKIEA